VLKLAVVVLGGSVCEVGAPVVAGELDCTVVLPVPELNCV
jgi:hypothetical protein